MLQREPQMISSMESEATMAFEQGLAAKEPIINIEEGIKQEEASIVVNASLMVGTKPDVRRENGVPKKRTRTPRYFELDNDEIHKDKRKQKPCYICGDTNHEGGHCEQFSDCFICSKRGHLAMECPDKNVEVDCTSRLCLLCGNTGHDISSCTNGYDSEDLKAVECYVCRKVGHICCVDNRTEGPKEASCYKCGQSGHPGSECAKDIANDLEPLCSRCGQMGHSRPECKVKRVRKARRKKKTNPMPEVNASDGGSKPDRRWMPEIVGPYHRKPGSNVWLSPAAAAARSTLYHRAGVLPYHQGNNHPVGTQVLNSFRRLTRFPHRYWNFHSGPQIPASHPRN